MAILIGTDEAGYGPNLGPLIISATAWQVPDELVQCDLFDVLNQVVSRVATPGCLAIADSKLLYKPGNGLAALEQGVLGSLLAIEQTVKTWREAWELLAREDSRHLDELPWYASFDSLLPGDSEPAELGVLGERFSAELKAKRITLLGIRSAAVFPARFNGLLDQHGSKGAALSAETLNLIECLLSECGEDQFYIRCDKHGGRNRYQALLQQIFPEYLVEVIAEKRQESIYCWGPRGRRVEVRFVAKGESFLPVALASMASKYLRELAMRAFNQFWNTHLPELKPTAGYPTDALRFKQDIHAAQAGLGIDDRMLWRNR